MISYLDYALYRREEIRLRPETAGRAVNVGPVGTRSSAHLNLTKPMAAMKGRRNPKSKQIIKLILSGNSDAVIAAFLKTTPKAVYHIRRKFEIGEP